MIQGTLGKWQEIILHISATPAELLIFFWEGIKFKRGQHAVNDVMFVHPEPYVRPTQNTSIPRGEELALSQCCLTELFRCSKTVNTLSIICTLFMSKVRLLECITRMFLINSSGLLIKVAYLKKRNMFLQRFVSQRTENTCIQSKHKSMKQDANNTILQAKLWFKTQCSKLNEECFADILFTNS